MKLYCIRGLIKKGGWWCEIDSDLEHLNQRTVALLKDGKTIKVSIEEFYSKGAFKRERKCFSCGAPILYVDFIKTNAFNPYMYNISHLTKLWNRKEIKLFCCNCFKKFIDHPKRMK